MTPKDMQAVMVAMRAVTETVEGLSNMVLALPEKLKEQLDEMRATIADQAKVFDLRMGSAQTAFIERSDELRGLFESTSKAASVRMDETAKIIADNRAVLDELALSTDLSVQTLIEGSDSAKQVTAELAAEFDKRAKAVSEGVFELNRKLATVVPEAETAFRAVIEGEFAERFANVEEMVSSQVSTVRGELTDVITGSIEAVTLQIGKATQEVHETYTAQLLGLNKQNDEIVSDTLKLTGKLERRIENLAEEQRNYATVTVPSLVSEAVLTVGQMVEEHKGETETKLGTFTEVVQRIDGEISGVKAAIEGVSEQQVESMKVNVQMLRGETEAAVTEAIVIAGKQVSAVAVVVEELSKSTTERADALEKATTGVAQTVNDLHTAHVALEKKQADDLDKTVRNISERSQTDAHRVQALSETIAERLSKETHERTEALSAVTVTLGALETAVSSAADANESIVKLVKLSDEATRGLTERTLQEVGSINKLVAELRESTETSMQVHREQVAQRNEAVEQQFTIVAKSIDASGISVGELRAAIEATRDATADALELAGNELDARIETAISLTNSRLLDLDERIDKSEETVRAELVAAGDAYRANTAEVFDKAVAAIEAIGKTQAELHAAATETAETLAKAMGRVDTVERTAGAAVTAEQLVQATRELGGRIEDAAKVNGTVEGILKDVNSLFEAKENQSALLGTIQSSVGANAERIEEVAKSTENHIGAEGVALITTEIRDAVAVVAKRVAEVGELFDNDRETLGNVKAALGAVTEQVESVAKQAETFATHEAVAGLDSNLAEVLKNVETVNETVEVHANTLGNIQSKVGELGQQIEARPTAEEVTKQIDAIDGSVRSLLTAVAENTDVKELDERVTAVVLEFGAVRDGVETLRKTIEYETTSLATAVDKRFESLPAPVEPGITPEQMAELETRVLSKTELPEPPVPTLEATMADGNLVITLGFGGAMKSVEIPVELGMRHRGVYGDGTKYKAGDVVTHKGSGWVCNGGQTGAPGTDTTGWTLFIKRGADGRSVKSYPGHVEGTRYMQGDFLRLHNSLWQAAANTMRVPEGSVHESTPEWTLIGGVQ